MSVAIGLTSLDGFPGTMSLSQEPAKGAGETPEEVAAIEHEILPKMTVAGFSARPRPRFSCSAQPPVSTAQAIRAPESPVLRVMSSGPSAA